jgi:hypothetical protein
LTTLTLLSASYQQRHPGYPGCRGGQVTVMARSVRPRAAESFWHLLGCIGFGAMYFTKGAREEGAERDEDT